MIDTRLTRRRVVTAGLAALAMPAIVTSARAGLPLDAGKDFGLDLLDNISDQGPRLQAAIDAAVAEGRMLMLPAGGFNISKLELKSGLHMVGVPSNSLLTTPGDSRLAYIGQAHGIIIEAVIFQANAPETAAGVNGLIEIEASYGITFRRCEFYNSAGNGISAIESALTIEDCDFDGAQAAAIHSQNGQGLTIRGNRIANGRNAGIRIWRDEPGDDGSIITGNRIEKIDWADGGNGQNGNGISIYKADGVIVSDNHIGSCAFSAIRVNAGKNTQIRGNTCLESGEVAIFSEFEFSGSSIADNIIDGAATGISITNLDSGGHLATCTGNIIRNIAPKSVTNPDTRPVGIYAEADTVVANNAIDQVPGFGIVAGYGPYLRNVIVSDNVLTNVQTGIGVSVVQEKAPGPVRVSGNIIGAGASAAVVGLEWEKVASDDLARDAGRYPNVTVTDNTRG
ncbi:MAG: TIGR03808 family TAT-translocated repetitive protein [Devosia sp.]